MQNMLNVLNEFVDKYLFCRHSKNYHNIKNFISDKEKISIILHPHSIRVLKFKGHSDPYSELINEHFFDPFDNDIIELIKGKTIYVYINSIYCYSIKKLLENNNFKIELSKCVEKKNIEELSFYVRNIQKCTIHDTLELKKAYEYLSDIIYIKLVYNSEKITSYELYIVLQFKKLKILILSDYYARKVLYDTNSLLKLIKNSNLEKLDIKYFKLNEEQYIEIITETVINSTIKHLSLLKPLHYSDFDKLINKLTIYNDNIETIENYDSSCSCDVYTMAPNYLWNLSENDSYYIGLNRCLELELWRKRNSIKRNKFFNFANYDLNLLFSICKKYL